MTDTAVIRALANDCLLAIKALRDEFPTGQSILIEAASNLTALCDALEAERAENERLRKALEPFAKIPDPRNHHAPRDQDSVWGRNGAFLTVGDFAAARAALTQGGE